MPCWEKKLNDDWCSGMALCSTCGQWVSDSDVFPLLNHPFLLWTVFWRTVLNFFFFYLIKNLLSHIVCVWPWCIWHQKVNRMDLLSYSFLTLESLHSWDPCLTPAVWSGAAPWFVSLLWGCKGLWSMRGAPSWAGPSAAHTTGHSVNESRWAKSTWGVWVDDLFYRLSPY